ncbi:chemotaxis-specific protein-glutamate methyltransferase CheB [Haloplanus rallus]|jgi:two-component system chemotaxis response regulator CheB|uniref:Protein-glutamate methylesterase/protein-glutamine glutaminase n=1 Tax=Haloplanus rallus TaxID=1816183 RepID=A0A6B9F805_9EURY|nr:MULTISPECIES: chemotaxis-specific protein-glutamate methyltransferase CheB [Haloplanus]QGX94497.1 chemotaxis-specific protein-glutamate methyltransferase CheB [Haloplanus rallus]
MSGANPRAVVVDDSHFMRTLLSDMLEDGGLTVVDTAANGAEAVAAVRDHGPDVVTMDLQMPEVDGLEAVERIMAERPTPILMLSAHTADGADVTFEALEKGAVDFFTKPGGEVSTRMSGKEEQLVRKVKAVAEADVGGGRSGPTTVSGTTTGASDDGGVATADREFGEGGTVVIASSTGGPTVVEGVVGSLPRDADLRVLVVQHMPDAFTSRFADRLDAASEYDVSEATGGDRIGGGEVLVAPGGKHLVVAGAGGGRLRTRLTEDPPEHGVRPAADVTMRSAADAVDESLVGVVLTGMGADGAAGVQAIHDAGGRVIAQDEASSAVFGMPKRAIERGCVDDVLAAGEIPGGILDAVKLEVNP